MPAIRYRADSGLTTGCMAIVIMIVAGVVMSSHLSGGEPRLRVEGRSTNAFQMELAAEIGHAFMLEGTSNLVEWFGLKAFLATNNSVKMEDTDNPGSRQRFYRARSLLLTSMRPAETDLLAGDMEIFAVDEPGGITNWIWSVNGITGGNAQVGTIQIAPGGLGFAAYRAPFNSQSLQVVVCAENATNAAQRYCATVRIHPLDGTLEIRPPNPTIGLGGQMDFIAGAEVDGVGFVRLRRVWWKINGILAGTPELGLVDFDGRFLAPLQMPPGLPRAIQLGFSLTVTGAVQAATPVRLVRLDVNPRYIEGIAVGKAAILQPTLAYSDGATTPVPTNQVLFESGNIGSVNVLPNGDVVLGLKPGKATLSIRHLGLGLTTYASAYARANVRLELHDVHVPSGETIRIRRSGASVTLPIIEIETTRPGLVLSLAPDVFQYRGTFNSSAPRLRTPVGGFIKARGEGAGFVTYNQTNRIAQPTGSTAIVEEETGIIQIGDQPGTGRVYFAYSDGVAQHETSVALIFSRPEILVQTRAVTSFATNQAYVTEPVKFTVTLTNRLHPSKYVGRTPLRIRELSGKPFRSMVRAEGPEFSRFLDDPELHLEVPSTVRETYTAENRSPWLVPGQVEFQVWPNQAGRHDFEIALANDPLAANKVVTIDVVRPSLRLPYSSGLTATLPVNPARTNVMMGTWENLEAGTNDPPGVNPVAGFTSHLRDSPDEQLIWSLREPDGNLVEIPFDNQILTSGYRPWLRRAWRLPGMHGLWLKSQQRPEVRTEELVFNVASLEGANYPAVAAIQWNTSSVNAEPQNRLGALRILAPADAVWIPDTPMDIVLQTIDTLGQPRQVGMMVITESRYTADPGRVDRTTNSIRVGGCIITVTGPTVKIEDRLSGTNAVNTAVTDPEGRIHLRLTVPGGTNVSAAGDLVVSFRPTLLSLTPQQVQQIGNPPIGIIRRLDGVEVSRDPTALDVAAVQNHFGYGLQNPVLLLGGRGLVINPPTLVLPGPRVRAGVAEGWLPAGSDTLALNVRGTVGFSNALASGLTAADIGPGLSVQTHSNHLDTLYLRLTVEPAYFETNAGALGARDISLSFMDGSRWHARLSLATYTIERHISHPDRNLPLNAAYSFYESRTTYGRHLDGTVTFRLNSTNPTGAGVQMNLELRPSIHACWDGNRNGLADPEEDRNQDGFFTEADNDNGLPFRNALPVNPVVGFSRNLDPATGAIQVRQLRQALLSPATSQFTIYGDLTDQRRLDESGNNLLPGFDPDLLPDFVSRSPDGELLLAWVGPTLVDAIRFTAYNFVARANPLPADPGLAFDQVRANTPLAYGAYGGLDPDAPLDQLAQSPKVLNPVSVYVDHEITPFERAGGDTHFPSAFVPLQFYTGMLDQTFQRRLVSTGGGPPRSVPLITDDRVRPYLDHVRPETGVERAYFGIDLDGVFYDASWMTFPRLRWVDATEVNLPPFQLIDENPNSLKLRAIPAIQTRIGTNSALSTAGLVPRVGGTSGGYVHLDGPRAGGLMVEAKTPGADFPGLHTGYLIQGKPEDLIDPRNALVEDDIRDVILKRDAEMGLAGGTRLVQESLFFSSPAPRYVLGFAQNEDQKEPIKAAARVHTAYRVTTDPEDVIPDSTNTWKISPAILVRERQGARTHPMDLVVASQSDGNEAAMKLAADAVTDLVVDITAGALLAAMTGGASLECTADSLKDAAKSALLDFTIAYATSETFRDYTGSNRDQLIDIGNKALRSGFEVPIVGISVPGYLDIREPRLSVSLVNNEVVLQRSKVVPRYKWEQFGDSFFPDFCDFLNAPVDRFKDAIKNTYSAETFGGVGSAEAVGLKLAALCIPKADRVGTNGLYTASFSISRKVDVQPEEPNAVSLADLPYADLFPAYPYCDVVSDDEFLRQLQALATHPVLGAKAQQILRDIGRKAVWRLPQDAPYRPYKIRAWNLPVLGGMMAPGMQLGGGQMGNFAFKPGQSTIPVATAAVAVVARSNENAASRVRLRFPGVDLIFVGGVIPDPRAPQ